VETPREKLVMARPYDPVKNVFKKEAWRLGVIIDDMWIVYKGDTEDHPEMLVRDIKVFYLLFMSTSLYRTYK
jgi:hypothetical protein